METNSKNQQNHNNNQQQNHHNDQHNQNAREQSQTPSNAEGEWTTASWEASFEETKSSEYQFESFFGDTSSAASNNVPTFQPTFQSIPATDTNSSRAVSDIPLLPPMPPEVEAQFQNRNNRMKIMESKEEYLRKLEMKLLEVKKSNSKKSPFEEKSVKDDETIPAKNEEQEEQYVVEDEMELKKPLLKNEAHSSDEDPDKQLENGSAQQKEDQLKSNQDHVANQGSSKSVIEDPKRSRNVEEDVEEEEKKGLMSDLRRSSSNRQMPKRDDDDGLKSFPPIEHESKSSCCSLV